MTDPDTGLPTLWVFPVYTLALLALAFLIIGITAAIKAPAWRRYHVDPSPHNVPGADVEPWPRRVATRDRAVLLAQARASLERRGKSVPATQSVSSADSTTADQGTGASTPLTPAAMSAEPNAMSNTGGR